MIPPISSSIKLNIFTFGGGITYMYNNRSFMHYGDYQCVCGRKFNNSQSFNAHKGHCILYVGEDRYRNNKKNYYNGSLASGKKLRERKIESDKQKCADWLLEEHTCENCNKIITAYYGSGRFCCPSCARSYSSKIAKQYKQSFKAFNYGGNRGELSPYEIEVSKYLDQLNITYINNATKQIYDTNRLVHGRYVLDFYLPDYKVDLEVDGRLHEDSVDYDLDRANNLLKIGIKTFRIKFYGEYEPIENQISNLLNFLRSI